MQQSEVIAILLATGITMVIAVVGYLIKDKFSRIDSSLESTNKKVETLELKMSTELKELNNRLTEVEKNIITAVSELKIDFIQRNN